MNSQTPLLSHLTMLSPNNLLNKGDGKIVAIEIDKMTK
jgi:hypothetical protein